MFKTHRFIVTVLLACSAVLPSSAQADKRPNVLFIGVDDLRPEVHCYGVEKMVTPNLDRLCKGGVRFNRAYCNIAVCGASRASIMKGIRPTPTRFVSYNTWAKKDAPDVPSLPMTFKNSGYHTATVGKIYHHQNDDAEAWCEPDWRTGSMWWAIPENNINFRRPDKSRVRGPAYESADKPDDLYPDYRVCDQALKRIRRLAKGDKPFFLGCGFYRPHLPFVAPKKYWDLYPERKIKLPDNMFFPRDLPRAFFYTWGELRAYQDIPKSGPVSEETARQLIRGYAACVSLVDVQIGRLLDELERSGVADNTIIVLWGDHGWQLGEHGFWCKHTNFEVATRVPLIIVAPGIDGGKVSQRLVEYVDIYPTLCELAGLPLPKHLVGKSMKPLLNDVEASHKPAVFSRHGGGDAVRTDRYRYMEMREKRGRGKLMGVGLFDLENDPDENQNVAGDPKHTEARKRLKAMLDAVREKGKS
ncbi:MAG: sulfatase [Pirellulales bacterium]|nr:sulfatase [Pirellulales bacterium]